LTCAATFIEQMIAARGMMPFRKIVFIVLFCSDDLYDGFCHAHVSILSKKGELTCACAMMP
jgi:hypothetical protein